MPLGRRAVVGLRRGLLVALPAAQLTYVGLNYFYSFAVSGGRTAVFPVGHRLVETSDHFIRTDRLHDELVAHNVQAVFADNLITWPLRFYDLETPHFRTGTFDAGDADARSAGTAAIVVYNGPVPAGGHDVMDARGHDAIVWGDATFRLDPAFDAHFLVYLRRPEPPGR